MPVKMAVRFATWSWQLEHWDHGFESHSKHELGLCKRLSVLSCPVRVEASRRADSRP
jgi:hypothetical protein